MLVGSCNHDFTEPSEDYVLFLVPSLQVETHRVNSVMVVLAIITSDAGDAIAQELPQISHYLWVMNPPPSRNPEHRISLKAITT